MWLFGEAYIAFNDTKGMDEIFVTKNAYFDKHPSKRDMGRPMIYNNIVSMATEDPQYKTKRKSLSKSFFKNKVREMTTIVKSTALKVF